MLSVRSDKCFVSWARSCLNFACSSGVNLLNSASVSKASVCDSLIGADASACTSLPSVGSDSIAESRMRLWTLGCKEKNRIVSWTSANERIE